MIRANVPGITASSARKRFEPQKLVPKPQREAPQMFGVEPSYQGIGGLSSSRVVSSLEAEADGGGCRSP